MPLIQITCIYLIVGALGIGTYTVVDGDLWWRFLCADIVMTCVTYAFSLLRKNSSVYSAYWSVIPFYFVVALAFVTDVSAWNWTQWAYVIVVSTWSWRLTHWWARSWPGWHHEDWRYVMFRERFGRLFQLVNFSGIHAYPTAIVFLSCIGMFWVATPSAEIIWLHALGLATAGLGIGLEYVADNQLVAFRRAEGRQQQDHLADRSLGHGSISQLFGRNSVLGWSCAVRIWRRCAPMDRCWSHGDDSDVPLRIHTHERKTHVGPAPTLQRDTKANTGSTPMERTSTWSETLMTLRPIAMTIAGSDSSGGAEHPSRPAYVLRARRVWHNRTHRTHCSKSQCRHSRGWLRARVRPRTNRHGTRRVSRAGRQNGHAVVINRHRPSQNVSHDTS